MPGLDHNNILFKTFTFFTIVKFEPTPSQVLRDNIIYCTFESKISQICTKGRFGGCIMLLAGLSRRMNWKKNEEEESSCHFLLKRTYYCEVQPDFCKVESLELQWDG